MVWFLLWGKKKKGKKKHVGLTFFSNPTLWPLTSEWCGELGPWSELRPRPGLVWARSLTQLAYSDPGRFEKALLVIECS